MPEDSVKYVCGRETSCQKKYHHRQSGIFFEEALPNAIKTVEGVLAGSKPWCRRSYLLLKRSLVSEKAGDKGQEGWRRDKSQKNETGGMGQKVITPKVTYLFRQVLE